MPEFRVTFGIKYDIDVHPFLPGVTAHHYVTVVAENSNEARRITLNQIGRYFATDYIEPTGGWPENWPSNRGYTEFARWDKDTPVKGTKVISVVAWETVVRRRHFTRGQLMEALEIEEWEVDRTDAEGFAEMFESQGSSLDGYEDSAETKVSILRDPSIPLITLESL